MNTKEAIKYLDELQDENLELQEEYNNKRILEVITLLKRGEKYKAIWEEFKSMSPVSYEGNYKSLPFPFVPNHIVMKRLEQKYFPKEESCS